MSMGIAERYDRIYGPKRYATEAQVVRGALAGLGVGDGSRVLDAGCGTGRHLEHLAPHFVVSGFDASSDMLEAARRRVPGAHLWVADLQDFQVPAPVDAAICLFSAIAYLLDVAALQASAHAFARAIRPGGIVLIEPWVRPDAWQDGVPRLHTYEDDDLKLARAVVAGREGDHSLMEMHWLVAPRGGPVEHVVEHHRMWLCPHDLLAATFEQAGFSVSLLADGFHAGRGLLVGRRKL